MKRDDLKTTDGVETIVIRALERKPEIAVPEDFAARVARSMPAKAPARAKVRPVFGQAAGYLTVAAMMVAIGLLTWRHPAALESGRGFLFVVELLLVAQLLAVGWWLGMWSDGA